MWYRDWEFISELEICEDGVTVGRRFVYQGTCEVCGIPKTKEEKILDAGTEGWNSA